MTDKKPHIVKRQVIVVRTDRQEGSFQLLDRVKSVFFSEVVPILEEILAPFDTDGETISIDKLEINLGKIREDSLDSDFVQATKREVLVKIPRLIHDLESKVKSKSGLVRRSNASEAKGNLLSWFLKSGVLPWWGREEEFVFTDLWDDLRTSNPGRLRSVLLSLRNEPQVFRRLALSLPQKQSLEVFDWFSSNARKEVSFYLFLMTQIEEKLNNSQLPAKILGKEMIAKGIEVWVNGKGADDNVLLARWMRSSINAFYSPKSADLVKTILQVLGLPKTTNRNKDFFDFPNIQIGTTSKPVSQDSDSNRKPAAPRSEGPGGVPLSEILGISQSKAELLERTFPGILSHLISGRRSGINLQGNNLADLLLSIKEKMIGLGRKGTKEILSIVSAKGDGTTASKISGQNRGIKPEEIYVQNAGLILIHPFLPAFFETLGFTEDGKFHSPRAAGHATSLLHYLCTGSRKFEEHQLALNKILCGLDPSEPIEPGFRLTQKRKNECEELLKTVISYWPAMKNVDSDGLRNTFFFRKGKLVDKDAGWELKIDRKTFDLVVDQLSWGFGVIKMPWSEKILYVDW